MTARRRPRLGTLIASCWLAGVVACGPRRVAVASDGAPRIDAVRPDSVALALGSVVEVLIAGRGFAPGAPGGNTIEFAGMSIAHVPANAAGTELRFVVPLSIASTTEAPPRPLDGGTYPLRVTTSGGTSNSVSLRIVR